ncbi:hypothetical protein B0H63DRAFT_445747 [Podospora didyma]|uniref:Uncharacterized protein n=1 Tax=Podospora didyma TaxID=330526 RepID=A0AAE0NXR3_9PEZI|nr:hypothetical protein B0H63DRAFT_445747 [Podospora didyma]
MVSWGRDLGHAADFDDRADLANQTARFHVRDTGCFHATPTLASDLPGQVWAAPTSHGDTGGTHPTMLKGNSCAAVLARVSLLSIIDQNPLHRPPFLEEHGVLIFTMAYHPASQPGSPAWRRSVPVLSVEGPHGEPKQQHYGEPPGSARSWNASTAMAPYQDEPPPTPKSDARALVAQKLWGAARRYSDSFSQVPSSSLYYHSLGKLDLRKRGTGMDQRVTTTTSTILQKAPRLRHRDDDTEEDSTSAISSSEEETYRPPVSPSRRKHQSLQFPSSSARGRESPHSLPSPRTPQSKRSPLPSPLSRSLPEETAFFSWNEYHPSILSQRRPLTKAPHEEFIDAFAGIDIHHGPTHAKGLGRLAKPLVHKYRKLPVAELAIAGDRTLLLPTSDQTPQITNPRALERLESELFDTAKYIGSSTRYITVLTWAADSHWGTITLFEVDLPARASTPITPTFARRMAPQAPGAGLAARIRPVAAMEDVPKSVLVNMRIDQSVRKVVLDHAEGRFRWRAQLRGSPAASRTEPRYARVRQDHYNLPPPVPGIGFLSDNEDEDSLYERRMRKRRNRRRAAEGEDTTSGEDEDHRRSIMPRPRPRALLRVDDAHRRSMPRVPVLLPVSPRLNRNEADADGIVATIPQFLALLHADKSIVEIAAAGGISEGKMETEDGDRIRAVTMKEMPQGKRHSGRNVHVVVLVPDGTLWAEEKIFWTDERDGLVDLRQRKYWDLVERGSTRRQRRMSRVETLGYFDYRDGAGSPPLTARSTAW